MHFNKDFAFCAQHLDELVVRFVAHHDQVEHGGGHSMSREYGKKWEQNIPSVGKIEYNGSRDTISYGDEVIALGSSV